MAKNIPLSQFEARPKTYIHPSWLAKAIAGDRQCEYSLWAQANYKIPKQDSDFDLEAYKIEHQALVDKTASHLESLRYSVYTEDSNGFWINLGNGKGVISAQPDIVAIQGAEVLVVECKTGKTRASDLAQNMIYQALIPVAKLHGIDVIPEGQVVYRNYTMQEISSKKITEEFKDRMRKLVRMLMNSQIPAATPSFNECQWCPISQFCDLKVEHQANGTADWL